DGAEGAAPARPQAPRPVRRGVPRHQPAPQPRRMVRGQPLNVDELIAREEITDVIKQLARGTDRLDEALMASCYHPDGFDDHNSFRGSGIEFAKWVCEV